MIRMQLVASIALTLLFGCGGSKKDHNQNDDHPKDKIHQLDGVWRAREKNEIFVLSAGKDGGFCLLSHLEGVLLNDPSTFGGKQIEVRSGSVELGRGEDIGLNSTKDSCAGLRKNSSRRLDISAQKEKESLILNTRRFDKIPENSVGDTIKTTAAILELLEKADVGCFLNGEFVSNPDFEPGC